MDVPSRNCIRMSSIGFLIHSELHNITIDSNMALHRYLDCSLNVVKVVLEIFLTLSFGTLVFFHGLRTDRRNSVSEWTH